ncbi:MAG: glucose PTS transporter subunit IIA, partial [Clostridium sp.]|nr:glucose PTS transporter subunit IIA [Clostridium sp.]
NEKQKQLFGTFSFSALMGVTEPAIYGAFVKFRNLFLAVAIGGGLGGLFAGIMNVKTYAMAWGLAGLPSYIGNNDYKNFYSMIIAVIIGFVAAAVAAYVLGIPKDSEEAEASNEKVESSSEKAVSSESDDSMMNKIVVNGCATGKLVKLSEVNDKAFSTGALGSGVGIVADNNLVVAPVDGEVTCVFPTKHAFGLKTESGAELLIHIGIDTVQLEGKHFSTMVNQGDKVKTGQPLVQVDFDKVKEDGFDPTIIMVVTNTHEYLDVIPVSKDTISNKEECINIVL